MEKQWRMEKKVTGLYKSATAWSDRGEERRRTVGLLDLWNRREVKAERKEIIVQRKMEEELTIFRKSEKIFKLLKKRGGIDNKSDKKVDGRA